ncbi:glycoside hydrolase [Paenibacillus rhizovicinus]|uniref:Glycoside hydrolase n=1 Tax=Paenibacillus rhizovicinus TaxID=2704463 RepID=A0A6C0P507_9BACL|nr:glycoside hydrolase [Paenibacillus rhizovicinus]QHW33579.1 glycoside hydrolase [Paenibacillus rhizovicinus]
MNRTITGLCAFGLLAAILSGCADGGDASAPSVAGSPARAAGNEAQAAADAETAKAPVKSTAEPFDFDVDPETFAVTIIKDGVRMPASKPLPKTAVTNVVQTKDAVKWTYPDKVSVSITKKNNDLDIQIESAGAESFQWPSIQADQYTLPIGEGKRIPAKDTNWRQFLKDQTLTWSESFSMDFFALHAGSNPFSLVYVVTNKYNNDVHFDADPNVEYQFTHEFPSINPDKSYGFRLYVTKNDPADIVYPYKSYVAEQGNVVTLEEKAKRNPNVAKLYGAPQIYLWSESILTDADVNWPKLRTLLKGQLGTLLVQLMAGTADGNVELASVLEQASAQDYMDKYQKGMVLSALNQALKMRDLYTAERFPDPGADAQKLIDQGVDKLSEEKLYDLNKLLTGQLLGDAAGDPSTWGQADSTDLIKDMHGAGIDHAWIGLPNWADGLLNPQLVDEANKSGYLIAPYDSYHSIHETQDINWNTASFPDPALYENATITRKDGSKVSGFLGQGRKLNPTLSLPLVQQRVAGILQDGVAYNSWFIDCDATGEIYDDYSPAHITTQQQDLNARLARLGYMANDKRMVVGSEGGNDYASGVIAFAQGIESPVIAWSDPDMREKKDSPYYVGGYYAPTGIPDRYGKPVPIKPLYESVYVDPAYSLPLYKLVYNDAVITTNHWEWGSDKIKGDEQERMLYELLYNVPPLYHLDRAAWDQEKSSIVAFLNVWSPFHEQAVKQEMSGFSILSSDRLVQSAKYGSELSVTVNFSDHDYKAGAEVIPAKSAVLRNGKQSQVFHAADAV